MIDVNVQHRERSPRQAGAPFEVVEKQSGRKFLAQEKPVDEELLNNIQMQNMLDAPDLAHLHQALFDIFSSNYTTARGKHILAITDKSGRSAILVYENADKSFLDTLVGPVRRSVTPNAESDPSQDNRENQVRVFVKQLLTALQYMHHRNIAHLDLRPEVILLQDDHLRLADFGQSRHLLCGKVAGNIKSNPEFVAPEIVNRKFPITLSADMWSVGALTHVLLFGQSPFIGDNDDETLQNVLRGEYSIKGPLADNDQISSVAKTFVENLLILDPFKRLNVDQALQHAWLDDSSLGDAKLATDCLREFKYVHNWLDRRVFVQQTASDNLIGMVEAPIMPLCSVSEDINKTGALTQTEPLAIYDYLKIKEASKAENAGRKLPISAYDNISGTISAAKMGRNPPTMSPRSSPTSLTESQIMEFQKNAPPVPDWIKAQLPPGVNENDLLWDPRNGGGFYLPPDKHPQIPPQLPPRSRSTSSESVGQPRVEPLTPEINKKIQTLAQQGAPPSFGNKPQSIPNNLTSIHSDDFPLVRLIRGEKRPIQDELANRILSDISEECSNAGSVISSTGPTIAERIIPNNGYDDECSSNTVTRIDGPSSSGTLTPIPHEDMNSPPIFDSHTPFTSQNLPLGYPLYLDEHLLRKDGNLEISDSIGNTIGRKNPISPSPVQQHVMSATISSGHTSADGVPKEVKKSFYRPLPDTEFELLMQSADRLKQDLRDDAAAFKKKRSTIDEELDKYRPKHFYKENDPQVHKSDPDDFAWESTYQIGPDTLLIPTRGAAFNARVRDYRREIWGDSASFVTLGELGARNADITVRERRRYTDLVREDPIIAKSVDTVNESLLETHQGAFRRVQENIGTKESAETGVNENEKASTKEFAPIFQTRLRNEICFIEGASAVTLECNVVGNPTPEVTFYHHESALTNDGRYSISINGEVCKMVIQKPALGVDTGEYSCVAINPLGRDKCSCRLISGDFMHRPSRPDVELSADTEVYITWDIPEQMPITLEGVAYRLEIRQVGEDGSVGCWTIVSDRIEDEAVVLKHLRPLGIYQFRVTAKNEFGWGEPSITSRIIRTHPRGVPKLSVEILRREGRRFAVVATPQRSSKKNTGLTEISEEFAEEDQESLTEESDEGYTRREQMENGEELNGEKAENGIIKRIPLNSTDDPLKRFQLESELFRGQFSVIRYAVDSKTGAHCTVKIRAPPAHGSLLFATPSERMTCLLSEYEALASCQHENVVQLIAAYNSNNFLLLFTQRLYENVFQRFLYSENYNEEQICVTIRQLASALRWIHFQGVVHLDVEPSNLMFVTKRSWLVKLIDFGRARQLSKSFPTVATNTMGKSIALAGDGQRFAEWTAPEVIKLQQQRNDANPTEFISTQADMWGLGLITFCLLAGFHPFAEDDDTEQEVRDNVLNQRCDPNLIPVQASEESLRFVTWALKKDPNRRMRPEEALNHRFLACDAPMVRRRKGVKYNSNRLRRTAERRCRQQIIIAKNGLGGCSPPAPGNGSELGGLNNKIGPKSNPKKFNKEESLAQIAKNPRLAAII